MKTPPRTVVVTTAARHRAVSSGSAKGAADDHAEVPAAVRMAEDSYRRLRGQRIHLLARHEHGIALSSGRRVSNIV
ncbi:MAG: hypothetical protein U0531_05090 [Dehalococcoidia bacterium]